MDRKENEPRKALEFKVTINHPPSEEAINNLAKSIADIYNKSPFSQLSLKEQAFILGLPEDTTKAKIRTEYFFEVIFNNDRKKLIERTEILKAELEAELENESKKKSD